MEFDLFLEYKVRKINVVTDALSKKVELAATRAHASEVQVEGTLLARIREGML